MAVLNTEDTVQLSNGIFLKNTNAPKLHFQIPIQYEYIWFGARHFYFEKTSTSDSGAWPVLKTLGLN